MGSVFRGGAKGLQGSHVGIAAAAERGRAESQAGEVSTVHCRCQALFEGRHFRERSTDRLRLTFLAPARSLISSRL